MDHPGAGPAQGIHTQPLVVQRNGADQGPLMGQNTTHLQVTGVLHCVPSFTAQELKENADEILRTGSHHHLIGVGGDAPEIMEILDDGRPQGRDALGLDGGKKSAVLPGEHLAHQLGPGGKGKMDGVHSVGGKIILRDGGGRRLRQQAREGACWAGGEAISRGETKKPRLGSERI